jgi:16S rRNA C967 or C1407 C5-methylase (RsmB/RsmF family)
MGELATQILRRVAEHMCRDGNLVYAVCSVLPDEAEQVLAQVADLFDPAPFTTDLMCSVFGTDACHGRLLPLAHGTDGYFVAQLRRR